MSTQTAVAIDARGLGHRELNERVRAVLADGAPEILLRNVRGQRYIGAGLVSPEVNAEAGPEIAPEIIVEGVPGNDLACFMDGPRIVVRGNAQDGVANTMSSGAVIVHGHAGDVLGYAMRGGRLFVRDDAGYRIGIHMKEYRDRVPVLIVGGTAKDYFGEYMAGGTLVLLGLERPEGKPLAGEFLGTGMHGGQILLRGPVEDWQLGREVGRVELEPAGVVEPGEIVEVSEEGVRSRRVEGSDGTPRAHCIFEHIYFARPDSTVFGESVHDVRVRLGERLAQDRPAEADVVFSVPDSGRSAALGYARRSGIPLDRGFIRNHYVGRTFIMPDQRGRSVDIKLNAVRNVVEGKRIVVVDDSIIRGTTSRRRLKLLRDAGAREIHVRISAPPCRHPCFYGIDFPSREELIAATRDVDEIREFLAVDSLGYQTIEGLMSAVSRPGDYCTACFTGEYPEEVVEPVVKSALENPVLGTQALAPG